MNKINSARYVKTQVENAAKQLVGEEQAKKIVKASYFTETVVNRMVARLPYEMILSNVQNELYKMHKSVLDYSGEMKEIIEMSQNYFAEINSAPKRKKLAETEKKTVVETIHIADNISRVTQFADELSKLNVTLFSSEPDMPLYASKGSPLLERLRQIVTVDDIKAMQEIKNKLSNGPHAIIAWYSALLGYKTVGQGMGDPRVSKLAEKIIKTEIKPALLIENPNSKQYINSFAQSFLKRCRASFKDANSRVGRDPMRKLQAGERVLGAIQLSKKHGLSTKGLEFGAACAIMYALVSTSEADYETQKIKEIYGKRHSVEDVLTYNGDYNKSKYAGLNPNDDHELIMRITENFEALKKELNLINI
jgi:hypothetical protein